MIIAQISDMHLRPAGDLAHDVADTAGGLAAAVERLRRMTPPPDVVLATGDLVDIPGAPAYGQLRRALSPLAMPVYVIPGNRDERQALRAEFGADGYLPEDGDFLHYVVESHAVRLIGLDTVIAGGKFGEMCARRLAWFDKRLTEDTERPTVVFMHHPPFKTGVPFMDEQPFTGANALADLVRRHPQVQLLACGHLHRPIQCLFANTLAAVAPSTAFQMPLELDPKVPLGVVMEPAAGLLHVWHPESGIVTHLLPLAEHPGPYPFRRRPPPGQCGDERAAS